MSSVVATFLYKLSVTFKEIFENILHFLHGLICVVEMIVNTVSGRMQWQRTYTVQRSVEPTYSELLRVL